MNRIFFTILLVLLLVTGGVLVWQWNVYSNHQTDSKTFEVNETIRMSVTNQTITINHEFEGLPKGDYSLQNTKELKISCREDKTKCEMANKDHLKTNGGKIVLTYSFKTPQAAAYVLNNWAVQIKDVKMNQTQIELTHYGKHVGIWAAGANLMGQTKKENISYFVFTGKDGIFPLYYQNKELKNIEYNGYTGYGESADRVLKAAKQYEVKTPFTFIISNKVDSFTAKSLLIRSSGEKMIQVLRNRFYNTYYPIKNHDEKWLQSLIGAYVLDEKVEGKSKILRGELSKQLSKDEQALFISLMKKHRGHDFSARYLDQLLSEVTGMKSEYFYRNKSEKRPLSPLYFTNNAKWYDHQGKGSNIEAITMNSKRYYSLTQVTEHLGFKILPISRTYIYLTNGTQSFRLYPGKNTFLYNDKAYSIKGELLKELNGKFYIREEYLLKIFNILVREQDNELQLISLN